MTKRAAEGRNATEAKPTTFSTWMDFKGVGSVGVTVYADRGVYLSVERLDGTSETGWIDDVKAREFYRVLAAHMEPREKARLQAESLAKLSPAERWALGLEEPSRERDERRRGR